MGDYLKERERERELEKIRGKAKRKPKEPMYVKPLKLGRSGTLYVLEDDPAEWDNNPAKFPKRSRRAYPHVIAVVSNIGEYVGSLDAYSDGDFFFWKPGATSAGSYGSTLWEALDELLPVGIRNPELKGAVDKYEAIYRKHRYERPRYGQ
jgi:hypothetical protein